MDDQDMCMFELRYLFSFNLYYQLIFCICNAVGCNGGLVYRLSSFPLQV